MIINQKAEEDPIDLSKVDRAATTKALEGSKGTHLVLNPPSLLSPIKENETCIRSNPHYHTLIDPEGIETITTSIPKIDLNYEGSSLSSSKTESKIPVPKSKCHYNLRSLDKRLMAEGPIGGIGMEIPQTSRKKSRGRKSLLSKAKVKAKYDMEDGKQMSITGVLRVAKPCEGGSK